MPPAYISERFDRLIAEGEAVLKTYNMVGNIDAYDLWITEVKSFLSVNAPQFLERLKLAGSQYVEQLVEQPYGRAAYNVIQQKLEVVKLAQASLAESDSAHNASLRHVIILVHGIRDFARWQNEVRSALQEDGFKAELTNYGRLNLVHFLLPFSYFRKKAIAEVWNQIRIIKQSNKGAKLSVIAHSFGTFVIAHLIRENFDIEFYRVIFCGSVVPYNFQFEQFQGRFEPPIINEVGTRDIWPAIAESVTSGYGSAGTFGFRRPLVRDRWHNGAHHGYYLDPLFCKNFWSPFLKNGAVVPGAAKPEPPAIWLQVLWVLKVKYILAFLSGALVYFYLQGHYLPLQ